jgi:hypothetical protein
MSVSNYPLDELSTFALLKVRLCDLNLDMNDAAIQNGLRQLYDELRQRGLRFRPHVWISTSWFSPYGIPGFAIPFYLFHPRLRELEQRYMGEVEGGTPREYLQLLRHESGHALDNAFHLRKSKRRQSLFGLSQKAYPKRYAPDAKSSDFVQHLPNHYAQAHPDEDWAETFAVWLDPQSKWQSKYRGVALEKLKLLDELVAAIKGDKALVANKRTLDPLSKCTQTLESYFREKQRKYQKFARNEGERQHKSVRREKNWILM